LLKIEDDRKRRIELEAYLTAEEEAAICAARILPAWWKTRSFVSTENVTIFVLGW